MQRLCHNALSNYFHFRCNGDIIPEHITALPVRPLASSYCRSSSWPLIMRRVCRVNGGNLIVFIDMKLLLVDLFLTVVATWPYFGEKVWELWVFCIKDINSSHPVMFSHSSQCASEGIVWKPAYIWTVENTGNQKSAKEDQYLLKWRKQICQIWSVFISTARWLLEWKMGQTECFVAVKTIDTQ